MPSYQQTDVIERRIRSKHMRKPLSSYIIFNFSLLWMCTGNKFACAGLLILSHCIYRFEHRTHNFQIGTFSLIANISSAASNIFLVYLSFIHQCDAGRLNELSLNRFSLHVSLNIQRHPCSHPYNSLNDHLNRPTTLNDLRWNFNFQVLIRSLLMII